MINLSNEQMLVVKKDMFEMYKLCAIQQNRQSETTDAGINSMYNCWVNSKKNLYDLLSQHPNWNEESLSIVQTTEVENTFSAEERREAMNNLKDYAGNYCKIEFSEICKIYERLGEDKFLISNCRVDVKHQALASLCGNELFGFYSDMLERNRQSAVNSILDSLSYCFRLAGFPTTITTESAFSHITSCIIGKNVAIGTKSSRVIKSVYDKLKVDTSVKMRNNSNKEVSVFEYYYARLSDCLSEKKKKVILQMSIHPANFIGQSYGNFSSCHNPWGMYSSGGTSYMNDNVSVVLSQYEYNKALNNKYTLEKQVKRQMCYIDIDNKKLMLSRLYPQRFETSSVEYLPFRTFAHDIMATLQENTVDVLTYESHGEKFKQALNKFKSPNDMIYPDWIQYYNNSIGYAIMSWNSPENELSNLTIKTNVGGSSICCRCGEVYDKHICSKEYGISNTLGNYRSICPSCNGHKKAITGTCAICGETVYSYHNHVEHNGNIYHSNCVFRSLFSRDYFPRTEMVAYTDEHGNGYVAQSELELISQQRGEELVRCTDNNTYTPISNAINMNGIWYSRTYEHLANYIDYSIEEEIIDWITEHFDAEL